MTGVAIMEYFKARLFLAYLFLTIIMETPVLFLMVRRAFKLAKVDVSTLRIIATSCLATLTTYPYLWYVFPALIPSYSIALVIAEIFVILIESLVIFGIMRLQYLQSFAASFACNLTTIVLGTLMNKLIVQYRLFLWEN